MDKSVLDDNAQIPIHMEKTSNLPKRDGLSGQQKALFQALKSKDGSLARMYLGGILVLKNLDNPERFPHAAHSMRELMEKLPNIIDIPTPEHRTSLKGKVIEIETEFSKVLRNSRCFSAGSPWQGDIDSHLFKFLQRLQGFFEWFSAHYPKRRAEIKSVLIRLEASGKMLPEVLTAFNVDAWNSKRDYFQAIAHHLKTAQENEFGQWLDAFERFLLDRLVPRTFEDFSTIDDLIREDSENA